MKAAPLPAEELAAIEPLIEGILGDDEHEGNPNFRPSGVAVAPDGSMYFMDWSQMLIGHLQHHLRDPNRHHDHGRIYRMTYKDRPLMKQPPIHGQSITALLDLLKEPENQIRELAKVELGARDTGEVIAATKRWAAALDKSDPAYEHHMMEALWVHQWHNVLDIDLLKRLLRSPQHQARAAEQLPHRCALRRAVLQQQAAARDEVSGRAGRDRRQAFESVRAGDQRLARLEAADRIDVRHRGDRSLDVRPLPFDEVERDAHRLQRQQEVRKQDRGIDLKRVDRLQRDLDSLLRRVAEFEERSGRRPDRAIFRQIASGLAHQPDRCVLGGLAAQGAQEGVVLKGGVHGTGL
mgnify:CR=1 FL=1